MFNCVYFSFWRSLLCVVGVFLRCVLFFVFSLSFRVGVGGYCLYGFSSFGACILFCAFVFRGLFSLWFHLFVGVAFLFGGDCMIVHSMVDYIYGNGFNIRGLPVMFPTSLVTWNYYNAKGVFGRDVPSDFPKNVARVPVLVISKSREGLSDNKVRIELSRFRVYSSELYSSLWSYRLVPYSSQTALIKACSEPYPTYDFERTELCNSRIVQKYKLSYYLSGTSPKFGERPFFLLLFDRRSDALKVLRKTTEVFRKVFDLLGADFSLYQTKTVYSLIEYMYNPTSLFAKKLIGFRWCHAFIGGLLKGVVNASEVSTEFLVGKDFEVIRWD
jgi:hypothetical protein